MSSPPAPGPVEEGWSAGALERWREAEAGVGTGEKSIMRVRDIQTGPCRSSQKTHPVVLFVTVNRSILPPPGSALRAPAADRELVLAN